MTRCARISKLYRSSLNRRKPLRMSLLRWSSSDSMEHALQSLFVLAFGCIVGSFLNVVRYRLPRKIGVAAGRSVCPNCTHMIPWYDNIPVLSFLILRRRCRWCGWKSPLTYFITEITTGIGFLLIWRGFDPPRAVAYWILTSILVACAGIDHDLGLIPDKLTFPGIALGLIFSVTLLRVGPPERSLVMSALGM